MMLAGLLRRRSYSWQLFDPDFLKKKIIIDPGSRLDRGARTQKPANERLRAFSFPRSGLNG